MLSNEILWLMAGILSMLVIGLVLFREHIGGIFRAFYSLFIVPVGAVVLGIIVTLLINIGGVAWFFVPFVTVGGLVLLLVIQLKFVEW